MTVHLVRLALELTDDPLQRGYAGMSDQAVADSLNAADRVRYRDVPVGELAGLVELHGMYEKLAAAVDNLTAARLLRLVRAETAISVIEWSKPPIRASVDGMLTTLVPTVLTEQDAAAIRALGQMTITRAEELQLLGRSRAVGPAHVSQARSL